MTLLLPFNRNWKSNKSKSDSVNMQCMPNEPVSSFCWSTIPLPFILKQISLSASQFPGTLWGFYGFGMWSVFNVKRVFMFKWVLATAHVDMFPACIRDLFLFAYFTCITVGCECEYNWFLCWTQCIYSILMMSAVFTEGTCKCKIF